MLKETWMPHLCRGGSDHDITHSHAKLIDFVARIGTCEKEKYINSILNYKE